MNCAGRVASLNRINPSTGWEVSQKLGGGGGERDTAGDTRCQPRITISNLSRITYLIILFSEPELDMHVNTGFFAMSIPLQNFIYHLRCV